uniref:Tetratricopeptide repeat domain 34 n=2 Tax=Latimeria chalumnae TaxID=7897 RepID=H3BI45_LATCH
DICDHLLKSDAKTYLNTLLVLRGFCHLHGGDHQKALEDYQTVIEDDSPHPNSCVKALCGRGLVRMLGGSPYLTALDYITARRLKPDEAMLTAKTYIPWNQRGLLYKVLQEEGQKMLQKKPSNPTASTLLYRKKAAQKNEFSSKEWDASGVYHLASLLLDLDPTDDTSRILCADALYQMERVEEAHKMLLVSLNGSPQRSSVLARLALLQLKKGFHYDANQLIKKVIQIGDTSCLLPIMEVFKLEDRRLMQEHCHSSALNILANKQGDTYVKEAVAYLSIAIIASGGKAEDSLLARARCYAHLSQKKTAIFDFNTILKENPQSVQALCGRGFMYMVLHQQKEAMQDLILALNIDEAVVIREVLSLKPDAQTLITGWLYAHCRTAVNEIATTGKGKAMKEELVAGQSLIKIDEKNSSWHILHADILIAKGMYEDALTHLKVVFDQPLNDISATARSDVISVKKKHPQIRVHSLSMLTEKDHKEVEFLLHVLDPKQRQHLAQVAAHEAKILSKENQHEMAMNYYTLAILASIKNLRYLRQRAMCLFNAKQYDRAIEDLNEVIKRHASNELKVQVEDFCLRGYIQLCVSKEEAAIKDYIKAMELDEAQALSHVATRPGRPYLSYKFHQRALYHFEEQHYEAAWNLSEHGLVIDGNNNDLKKLKVKIKREASGCIVH